jgi:hypothetical protein
MTIVAGQIQADDDVKNTIAFARMKVNANYNADIRRFESGAKEGEFFVLWVGYEDATLYARMMIDYPQFTHSYIDPTDFKKLDPKYTGSGLIIAYRRSNGVERLKDIPSPTIEKLRDEINKKRKD